MAQIIRITSEALQATIRRLLPSQQGFGEDLQASNVITPIIDLTPTAEGSALPTDLQNALAFGSQTAFSVANATTTIINTAGFHRVFGTANTRNASSVLFSCGFNMSDGLASKTIISFPASQAADEINTMTLYDFVVFLNSGDSLIATSDGSNQRLNGSTRQIADVNGNLIDPVGFQSQ